MFLVTFFWGTAPKVFMKVYHKRDSSMGYIHNELTSGEVYIHRREKKANCFKQQRHIVSHVDF